MLDTNMIGEVDDSPSIYQNFSQLYSKDGQSFEQH